MEKKCLDFSTEGETLADIVVKVALSDSYISGGFVHDSRITKITKDITGKEDLGGVDTSRINEKFKSEGYSYNRRRKGYENKDLL